MLCFRVLKMNPGHFVPITCSPRKVNRFAPLNRYYIILDEVFFDNFLVIIYLLLACQKKIIIHSFWSTLIIYLLVVYKKNNNSFILIYFCQRSWKWNFSCKVYKKPHKNSKKVVFFVPTQKCMKWLSPRFLCRLTAFMDLLYLWPVRDSSAV